MQNNQDHLRFRRRGLPTAGDSAQKSKFGLILTATTVAILLPVMIYGLMHPQQVTSTVTQIARHVHALPMKEVRVAVIAVRTTPQPSPSPAETPTPSAAQAKKLASETARPAHHKHHARALAATHAKKVASADQSSDVADLQQTSSLQSERSSQAAHTGSQPASSGFVTPAPLPTAATVAAAAAPDADATPVYAPEVVVDARFTRQVQPEYPAIAREQGVSGTAVVLATIGPDGKVISTRIDQSTGNHLLDQAALEAARESGFAPPVMNGKPATETYRLVYNFEL